MHSNINLKFLSIKLDEILKINLSAGNIHLPQTQIYTKFLYEITLNLIEFNFK